MMKLTLKKMKNIAILLSLILSGTLVFGQASAPYYKSKSGKVSYKFEVGGTNVDYTLTFDHHGEKQSFYTKSIVDGNEVTTKTIVTKEFIYVINYEDKQVIKFPIDAEEGSANDDMGGGIDVAAIVDNVDDYEQLKQGTETLLGKKCDVYILTEAEGGKGKYWIWNNFLLKAEFVDNEGVHTYVEATQFDPDVKVPESEFKIPEGYEVTDMGDMMKQMQQMQEMYGIPTEE